MAILGGSGISVTDVSDALVTTDGLPPRGASNGTLWLDGKTLKKYENGNWVIQEIDVTKLDPDLSKKIEGIMDNLGTIGDDSKLTFNDRSILARELGEIIGVIPSKTTGNVYPSSLPAYNVLDSSGSGTFSNVRARAVTVGMDVNDSRYKAVETAYTSLNSYLSQYNPKAWDITTANKDKIVTLTDPDMFRQKFLDYYTAELKLATEVERVAKESAEEYVEELTDGVSLKDKTEILSGNPIFTDKADDNSVVHVEVDGKSVGGGDKNLFSNFNSLEEFRKLPIFTGTREVVNGMGLSFTNSKITIPAWDGSSSKAFVADVRFGNLKPNTKYVFSFDSDTTLSTRLYAFLGNSVYLTKGRNSLWFTTDANGECRDGFQYIEGRGDVNDKARISITVNPDSTSSNLNNLTDVILSNFILEEGETPTDYSTPVPTPDYPVAINSLNNVDIVSSVGKRNLRSESIVPFPNNSNTTIEASTDHIYKGTISYKFGSQSEVDALKYLRLSTTSGDKPMLLEENRFYTASWYVYDPKNYNDRDTYVDNNNAFNIVSTQKEDLGGGYSKRSVTIRTVSEGKPTTHGFLTYARMPIGEYVYISGLKIEESEIPTPLSTPLEEVNYDTSTPTVYKTNISLPEPLRSVGDVKDRLFRDGEDGLLKVERKITERVLDGSENWSYESTSKGYWTSISDKENNSDKVIPHISTHFTYKSLSLMDVGTTRLGANKNVLFNWDNGVSGVSGFKSWLLAQKTSGNPVTIVYRLETPIIETLPDDLQQKLNNIQSYKGSNYVYTVLPDKSDILSPTLHATFKSKGWYRNFNNEAWKVESEKALENLDKEIGDVDKVAQALKNFTDTAFADGIIQMAEAQAISEHLNTLNKENVDLSNQYTTIYGNTNLIGTPKTNLASAKTAYNTAYTNLTNSINTAISGNKTTPAQKTDVDNKFTSYSNALKLLNQRLNEALSAIADKIATDVATAKANVAKTEASAYADGIVTAEEKRAIADAKAKLAEAQKYADNAVEKVEVGGRNYFTKGHTFTQTTQNSAFYPRDTETPNGFKVTGNQSANGQIRLGGVITENGWWTVSFDIRGSQSVAVGMTIDICDLGSTRVWTNTTNTYRRVSVSVNVTNYSSSVYNFVDFGSISWNYFWVDNIKVEKGNKATDWSPAPEDQEKDLHNSTRLPVRYIRDWLAGSDMNNGSHWVEIQAIQNGVNVAKGTTVTASPDLASSGAIIVDGNTATGSYVAMNTPIETVPDPSTGGTKTVVTPGHVIIDLGKVYNDLESIKVWHYYADERTYNNTLTEVSVDGENWTALYDSEIMGVYPETSQGRTYSVITNQLASNAIQHTTNLVSRVNNVEQQITADAIVSTVMAQEKFTSWQEVVDAKPTPEAFDLLSGNLSSTADTVATIETRVTEVEQTATSWGVSLNEQQEIIKEHGTTVSNITTYMSFKDTGLEIGKSDSNMKVNISNTQIDFMDNGTSVAWINGQQLYIRNAQILDTLVVGNHKFEKLGTDMTVISWNGE